MSRQVRKFERFELDVTHEELHRDGKPVPIAERLIKLLLLLTSRDGHRFSRDAIYKWLWSDPERNDNGIDKAVSDLRLALFRAGGEGVFIPKGTRKGYVFSVHVRREEVEDRQAVLMPVVAEVFVKSTDPARLNSPSTAPLPQAILADLVPPAAESTVEPADPLGSEGWPEVEAPAGAKQPGIGLALPARSLFRWRVTAAVFLAAIAMGGSYLWLHWGQVSDHRVPSVFVRPVLDHTDHVGKPSLARGLTDELVSAIDKSSHGRIFVFPWAESMRYEANNPSLNTLRRELGTDYVLDTVFYDNGIGLTLNAHLHRVDGKPDIDPYVEFYPVDAKTMQKQAADILADNVIRHIMKDATPMR